MELDIFLKAKAQHTKILRFNPDYVLEFYNLYNEKRAKK